MPNETLLSTIDDVQLRQYVRTNWNSLVDDAEALIDAYSDLDPSDKADMHAGGDAYFAVIISTALPGWDWDRVQAAIRKRLWVGFCVREDDQGKPDPDWAGIFDEEGLGRKFIEAAVVAGFAAAGAAVTSTTVGGGLGAVIVSAGIGLSVRDLLVKTICKILDEEIRSGLGKFCAEMPA